MRLRETLKGSFVTGLVLVAPLVVTLVVLQVAFSWTVALVDPVVRGTRLAQYTANIDLVAQAVAIVALVAVVTALGFLARWSVGRRLFGRMGQAVNFLPLVGVIYGSARQVATALVERSTSYESVVLVEYPREGLYSIGFVTGPAGPDADAAAGEPVYNVFTPNSPNPTGGRLVLVPESQLHETDMSVREGIRTVVTTGMGERAEPTLLPDGPG